MDEQNDSDGVRRSSFHIAFHKKRIRDHLLLFVLNSKFKFFIYLGSAFGLLWVAIESFGYLFRLDLSGSRSILWVSGVSLLVAVIKSAIEYLKICPDGIDPKDVRSRRLAHMQSARWEPRLAHYLLSHGLKESEARMDRIVANQEFVSPNLQLEDWDSIKPWFDMRIFGFHRLIEVFGNVVVQDFLMELFCSDEDSTTVEPLSIKLAVDRIVNLHRAIVDYEIEARKISLSANYTDIEYLIVGWSKPIRDGFAQLLTLLKTLETADLKDPETKIDFTIVVGESKPMMLCIEKIKEIELAGNLYS